MKKLLIVLLVLSAAGFAQNAQIPTKTFSFQANAIGLAGNRGTFAGMDAGVQFSPTPNFSLQEGNIVSSDAKLSSYMGLVEYDFPYLSLKANNAMPTLSGFRLKFGVRAGAGIDRVKDALGVVKQYYAALAQGTFSYSFDAGSTWQLGANVGMARFPGYAKGWTPVAEVGPSFHF